MNRLKQIRESIGITARAMSVLQGVRPNTICDWEHNDPPKAQHVNAYMNTAIRDALRAYVPQLKKSDTTRAVGETLESMVNESEK